jgi:hypothetical protein
LENRNLKTNPLSEAGKFGTYKHPGVACLLLCMAFTYQRTKITPTTDKTKMATGEFTAPPGFRD